MKEYVYRCGFCKKETRDQDEVIGLGEHQSPEGITKLKIVAAPHADKHICEDCAQVITGEVLERKDEE